MCGCWWVGCYIWYSEEGTGWSPSPPRPLFAVPNVTAHPSTRDRQEVRSEDQGTQERSRLFHSWYTDSSLQGKGEQYNSQVSHHRPCRGREPCHQLGQGKRGRQRGTATDQMDKTGTLDQKDTDVHKLGCRILPTQPQWDQVISRSRAPSSCKQ